jgi:hypothetical protein
MAQAPQTRSVPSRGRSRRSAALGLAVALTLLAAGAAAGPALEYGPEAEARFLEACAASSGPADDCHRLSERLQAALGYEVFLAHAAGGPGAFLGLMAARCAEADGLGAAEPTCGATPPALATR